MFLLLDRFFFIKLREFPFFPNIHNVQEKQFFLGEFYKWLFHL